MLSVASIVGARPQFVKAATVSRLLRSMPGASEILIHTGQHYDSDMSDIFFQELCIPNPDWHLGIGSGSHGAQTGRMIEAIEVVLKKTTPDLVLVYGDTNSTLAGALASVKLGLPTCHVEAGLRSFNRAMPEEINRVLVDHCSDLLFAPTKSSVNNLSAEGIADGKIWLVGDVMYDAALFYAAKAIESRILGNLALQSKSYVLATVHRAENTDEAKRLLGILEGLHRIANRVPVVFPVHPRTRAALTNLESAKPFLESLRIIAPVGYLDMIALESNALAIATDSGGVQKEAFFYQVPCFTLRDETEWIETVASGANRLVGTNPDQIEKAFLDIINGFVFPKVGRGLYGEGNAAKNIIEIINRVFG